MVKTLDVVEGELNFHSPTNEASGMPLWTRRLRKTRLAGSDESAAVGRYGIHQVPRATWEAMEITPPCFPHAMRQGTSSIQP